MNFTEVVTEVVEATKRPDKISIARREVNAAISFYCLDNECPRDFVEQQIVLDAQAYTQSFSITDMTRFRKFKYLRRARGKYLDLVSIDDMKQDLYCDRYYIAGNTVNISLEKVSATLDIGYYSYPPHLSDSEASFWLLDHAPYMVIDRACAAVFKQIGDEKSFQAHSSAAAEHYRAFRKDLAKAT